MKTKNLILLLGLTSGSFLAAQFSTDFTTAEGYVDGPLNDNADWTTGSPASWTVDADGSGTVAITPINSIRARYVGSGSPLVSNDYTTTAVFTLNYTVGTSAAVAAARLLGRFEYENLDNTAEYVGAALRQKNTGPGEYHLALVSFTSGAIESAFGSAAETILAADLGLAHDGTNWTDGSSDVLEIVHTVVYDGSNWVQNVTLTNLTTATVLGTLSKTTTDADNSFVNASQGFVINSANLGDVPNLTLTVDSVDVAGESAPPPTGFVVDFTAAEGYANGSLDASAAWTVLDPAVWNVTDSAGAGLLTISPSGNFQNVTYVGEASALTSNSYSSTNVFFLDYSADTLGENLTPPTGNNTMLARFQFLGGGTPDVRMRQMADGPGRFSMYLFSDLNALNPQLSGITLDAADIGLAHDGSNWIDSVSDPLQIKHYLVYDDVSGKWTQIAILTNLATSTVLDVLEQTYTEDDNSFRDTTNKFAINNGRLFELPHLRFTIDSVTVSVIEAVPAEIAINSAVVNPGSEFVIDFTGSPSTTYQVMKSTALSGFRTMASPVSVTTDGSGVGRATVPSSEMGDARQFFRLVYAP